MPFLLVMSRNAPYSTANREKVGMNPRIRVSVVVIAVVFMPLMNWNRMEKPIIPTMIDRMPSIIEVFSSYGSRTLPRHVG